MALVDDIARAVFEIWRDGQANVTMPEIADYLKVSAGHVGRVLSKHGGAVPGTVYDGQRTEPSYSRSYPGIQVGTKRFNAWRPSDAYIRERLKGVK